MPHLAETVLGRAVQPGIEAYPGKSGVVALQNGRDAFAARALRVAISVMSRLPVEWLL